MGWPIGNVAWLQELPKPLTKITWDNVIAFGPALAAKKGLSNGDVVEVRVGAGVARGPAWIVPGHAPNTVAVFFGYGRRAGGDIAKDSGYDAFAIQPRENTFAARGSIGQTGRQHACRDDPGAPPHGRLRFRPRGDSVETQHGAAQGHAHVLSRLEQQTPFHRKHSRAAWGMAIDLDSCIGCNACVVACNAENNVPVVGKDQVAHGPRNALAAHRSLLRRRREESAKLLPAGAVHALREGAVRDGLPGPRHRALAPKASTRWSITAASARAPARAIAPTRCGASTGSTIASAGIADAGGAESRRHRALARRDGEVHLLHPAHRGRARRRPTRKTARSGDGEVVTACQQACPTKAIVFGDVNDTELGRLAQRRRQRAALCVAGRSRAPGRAPPIWRAGTTSPAKETAMSEVRCRRSHPAAAARAYADVTDQLAGIPLHFPARRIWLIALLVASALLGLLFVSATVLFTRGVGIWGINIPVNWAFADPQLRLVAWHRPRRHADLGAAAAARPATGATRSTASPKR